MLLDGKTAVIYGGGGSIGRAMATAFAREGAHVFLVGRTQATLDRAAEDLRANDVNLVGVNDVQGTPLAEMTIDDFLSPITTATRTQFLTTRAAARQMITQGSGVMLFLGGSGDPIRDYSIGGFQIALEAIEALRKQLASELGKFGVRVVSLRTGGIADTIPSDFPGRDDILATIEGPTRPSTSAAA
jgi:3-oxoacyl-[acyl-carrier protein] reductase